MSIRADLPILIVGAGIVGNTLAQCLRQRSIPFLLFERDSSPDARDQGWGLSLTWALEPLLSCLPLDIREDVFNCQVDPSQWEKEESYSFSVLDALTLQPKIKIPASKRLRIQREKLRCLLMRDLDVLWNKKFKELKVSDDGVTAIFEDGTSYKGCLLVGADGSHSQVRRAVAAKPDINPLPVRMLGTKVVLSSEQAAPLLAIDPLYFMSSHPTNGTSLFTAVFEKKDNTGHERACQPDQIYVYQLCIAYPVQTNALKDLPDARDSAALLKEFHSAAQSLHPILRDTCNMAGPESKIIPITIADWEAASWDGQSRVTLMGDAAHAMTMFRGEGANHGIKDALEFIEALDSNPRVKAEGVIDKDVVGDVLRAYEAKMHPRAREAVLRSRQACLDTHGWGKVSTEKSKE